jgi:hypothetical protein
MTYAGLITWAIGGVLGLILQATLLFKDLLVAYQASLKAPLTQLCVWADCQILPLQLADAVVIDHAAIDLLHHSPMGVDDVPPSPQWSFEIHLRNSAKVPVATPQVELTLTDAQDQALMRKVIDLSSWGAPAVMAPGQIVSLSRQLGLRHPESGFMGYRLLTFYP